MADDGIPKLLPFRAEYAKTARGACKTCKSPLDKDELKLGVMVQSRFHDGMDCVWSHVSCFFQKKRPKTVGDIANFENLRFSDQELIKKKLDVAGGAPASAAGGSGSKLSAKERLAQKNAALKDYIVVYAVSGRSTCKVCDEPIPKDEIRISKKDYDSEEAARIGQYTGNDGLDRWHHVDCFVKVRAEFGFFESGKLLPGFKKLEKEDQDEVAKKLPAIKPTAPAAATATSGKPATSTGSSSTSKRKLDDQSKSSAGAGSSKRAKKEKDADDSKDVKKLKKQMDELYKYRDAVKDYSRKELLHILSYNKQEFTSDGTEVLDRIGDIMTFGALQRCPKCKTGQFVFKSGIGYQCLGNMNEFTKCLNITQDPERVPFKVPKDLRDKEPFVTYKFKPQKRILQKIAPSAKPATGEYVTPKLVKQPLKDFCFLLSCVADNLKEKKWNDKITEFSGTVVNLKSKSKATKAAALITTEDEMAKGSPATKYAEKKGIPVLKEEFVDSVKELNYNLVEEMNKNMICSWVPDITVWLRSKNGDFEEKQKKLVERKAGSDKFETKETKVKLIMKGGAVVDPASDLEDVGHVLKDGGRGFYNCVLNRTSVEEGKNSYYKQQIIESDSGGQYWVFQAWGRIGTVIGGTKVHDHVSKLEAIEIFCAKFFEITGNIWGQKFQKLPGRYTMLELDYGEKDQLSKLAPSSQNSTLPLPVQELVSLIFDVDRMKQAMMEFELNLEEMPLGKISRKQVLNAYSALGDATKFIQKFAGGDAEAGDMIRDVTNRFYTMIPHTFGSRMPPLLDNDALVKTKLDMLESLLEIELAYEMLLEGNKDAKGGESQIDSHYKTLSAAIDPVETGSEEFGLLQKYLKNTHADTHTSYTLDIEHIFKVKRQAEEGKNGKKSRKQTLYENLHNKKLLWHGSRITNYAGILSQGLRIAPKEAPVTGYMFGKGVYFADMVSKSANYCHPSRENNSGLLLVCEVALGNMHELKRANDELTKAPKDFHSVKGLGLTHPNPEESVTLPDGIEIPLGTPVPSKVKNADLLYNEYIVYDTEQVKIRYLVKVNFNFATGRRR